MPMDGWENMKEIPTAGQLVPYQLFQSDAAQPEEPGVVPEDPPFMHLFVVAHHPQS